MNEQEPLELSSKIDAAVKAAVAEALDRHRKLGESIAIWQDGKVVILTADRIPPFPSETKADKSG